MTSESRGIPATGLDIGPCPSHADSMSHAHKLSPMPNTEPDLNAKNVSACRKNGQTGVEVHVQVLAADPIQ